MGGEFAYSASAAVIRGPALTLFYVSVILLLLNNYSFKLGAVKAAGRASLSNYLMQSLVCTLLFIPMVLGCTETFQQAKAS